MDQTDRQIIDLLCQDGRRSNVEIARALSISEGTVRKRIERLLMSGTLHVVGLVNPGVAGLETRTLIFLTVELAQVERVGRLLCAMPEVMSVYCVTGEYDLVVEAVFASDKHLMSFLTERVGNIPGVMGSKTSHVPQILKHSHEWTLPEPPPPTIMIVDDDPDFVEVTHVLLEREGYQTRTASSGNAALQAMTADPPDLLIMDIMMQGILDGWDASRRVRQDPRLRHLPILAVSSITSTDYLSMVPTDDDNLIDNFFSKPVDAQQLVAEVKRLLKRR
jgi:Lrp/AsnC family transcriptional regulator, regulator for asnA, asnC and gidA